MEIRNLIPWRIRNRYAQWLEHSIRPHRPHLYKLLKYGRTNLNTPDYWDNVWKNDTVNREYNALFRLVLDRVPAGAAVLDVGCGIGNLSRLLRDERAADVTALDFSAWACEQLRHQGFRTVVASLPRIPLPDRQFDVAVATEVLEHLDAPEKTLAEMARVVKSGGFVLCSVPDDTLHPNDELEHQQIFTQDILGGMLARLSPDYEIVKGTLIDGDSHGFLFGILCIK